MENYKIIAHTSAILLFVNAFNNNNNNNKVIVDYTLPALCTAVTLDAAYRQRARGGPSHGHRQHAQKIGKDRARGSGDILADRQTDRHTDINLLITILRNRSRGRSNKVNSKPKQDIFVGLQHFIMCAISKALSLARVNEGSRRFTSHPHVYPQVEQGNCRYHTSPALRRCALPSPPSRPIGRIACAQNFPNFYLRLSSIVNYPFCCMTLLAIE